MSIPLPPVSGGSILPEYEVMSSMGTRQLVNLEGRIVPVISRNGSYQRTDYLVNDAGSKVAIVNTDPQNRNAAGVPSDLERNGNFYVSPEELATDLAADPELAAAFARIAAYEDGKVKADLLRRGILQA